MASNPCRNRTAHWIVAAALLAWSSTAVRAEEKSISPDDLLGCWTRTSPYSRDRIPAGREWGSAKWCFRDQGQVETWTAACGPAGCDGWDGEWDYRWRDGMLELPGWTYDDKGHATEAWRRCRPVATENDRMVLKDCSLGSEEWVKEAQAR